LVRNGYTDQIKTVHVGIPGNNRKCEPTWETTPGPASLKRQVIGADEIHLRKSNNHKGDFVDRIKRRQDPIANAEVGHRTSTLCHLGNIAMLLKRPLRWDPNKEGSIGDDAANRMRRRPRRVPWTL
jgi:hypothetical protein